MTTGRWRGLIAGLATAGAVVAPALLLAALPPATLQPQQWTLLPGWAYAADGLSVSLAALLLLLVGPILAQAALTTPVLRPARLGAGCALLLLALAQTVFAANTGGRWLGLEGAGLALWLIVPGTPRAIILLRHLAGYPLLAVALSGLLDAPHAPGQVIPALPAWLVLALLVSALVRIATLIPSFQHPTSNIQHPPNSQPPIPNSLPKSKIQNPKSAILYAAVTLVPLLRSLAAGPWDAWGRFAVVAVALALLGGTLAYCVLRITNPIRFPTQTSSLIPHPSFLIPHSSYLLGAVLLGLGLGSAAGVSGALALGAVGLAGSILSAGATTLPGPDGAALRGLGRLSVLGLPPFAGFAGLWLLAGALLPARYPLGLVLLLALAALLARNSVYKGPPEASEQSALLPLRGAAPPHSAIPLLPLAAVLLLGGLAPALWLDGLVRPAADTLAAGVPALSSVTPVPGLGYMAGPDLAPVAAWPVLGLSVALALAWLGVELVARLRPRRPTNPQPPAPNPRHD